MTLLLKLSETFDQDLEKFQTNILELAPAGARKILTAHFRGGNLVGATCYLRTTINNLKQIDADELLDKRENSSRAEYIQAVDDKLDSYEQLGELLEEWTAFLAANGGDRRLSSYLRHLIETQSNEA